MKHGLLASALLLGATSAPSFALDLGNGFSASGEIEVEHLATDTGNDNLAYGTLDLGFQQPDGPFGGYVGFDTIAVSGEKNTRYFAALTYSSSFGKFQIGSPRPLIDDYFTAPALGGARLYEAAFPVGKSLTSSLLFLGSDIETPIGLRYDGEFGALKAGASYSKFDLGKVMDLAASYTVGKTTFSGALERLEGDTGFSETVYHLGAEMRLEKLSVGAVYTSFNASNQDLMQVYATYSPLENLDLTASYLQIGSSFSDQDGYGLAAKYTLANGLYAEVGYADSNLGQDFYNASVGMKF